MRVRNSALLFAVSVWLSSTDPTAFGFQQQQYGPQQRTAAAQREQQRGQLQASSSSSSSSSGSSISSSDSHDDSSGSSVLDRRMFGRAVAGVMSSGLMLSVPQQPANAQVFFDPAQYGDQELRVSAVDSLKESVRRAILQNPQLAPSFYQLSLLDGLSFDAKTKDFGPDGSIIKVVLSSNADDIYTKNLQKASLALVDAEKVLRRKTAITLADAVAIGGAEAIESIGGPVIPVQLGRADAPLKGKVSDIPLDLFSGNRSVDEVAGVFRRAGITEREMTALLGGLLTLEAVEKSRSTDDWKAAAKPKFREAGKLGRMSEFRKLTDEDIAQAELEADPEYEDPDDGWYIADSFGTREERFGGRLAKDDISEKTFNKYLKELAEASKKKQATTPATTTWVAEMILDPSIPTSQSWLNKYASSNLSYLKDLSVSFNSITQLGAVYTGGKYEALLKSKPRKSLNNDDLNLF